MAVASAEAYLRRFPEAEDRAAVLYRLALLLTRTDYPEADRDRAVSLLERLLAEHPESGEAASARVILDFARESDRLEAELDARVEELGAAAARLDQLATLVSEKDAEAAEGEREAADRQLTAERATAELAAARAKLAACQAEVERLVAELDALKRIDLEGPP